MIIQYISKSTLLSHIKSVSDRTSILILRSIHLVSTGANTFGEINKTIAEKEVVSVVIANITLVI